MNSPLLLKIVSTVSNADPHDESTTVVACMMPPRESSIVSDRIASTSQHPISTQYVCIRMDTK